MIKGISFLRATRDRNAYDRLARFFAALGLEHGRGWEESFSLESGAKVSRGASFLAPLGNLEFVDGDMPPFGDVAIEVTSLDAAHQAAASWFHSEGLDPADSISPI